MTVAVACSQLLGYRVGGDLVQDALATAVGSAATAAGTLGRLFVPGFLPCGECPLCRRGLVGACRTGLRPFSTGPTGASGVTATPAASAASATITALELPERFVVPIDEPAGAAFLPDDQAVTAGVVAFALHAMATASLAPGDFAVWLGAGALATAGVSLSASRGGNAFALTQANDTGALAEQLAALAAVPATVHGSRKRLLFLTEPELASWTAATALGEPGATFVVLGASSTRMPAGLTLPAEARIFLLSAYHPDFVPEALAALRRNEVPALHSCADLVRTSIAPAPP